MNILTAENISFGYDDRILFQHINFSIQPQEFLGVLGPNGSGKTTLLKLISGVLRPRQGSIFLKGKNLKTFSRREMAKVIAVLPQETVLDFPFTALEVVLMGRHPYLGNFGWETKHDFKVAYQAMEDTDCRQFSDQDIRELSGGERERVFLARALAQEPEILLLDEPTTHLDLKHQSETFRLLNKLHTEKKLTLLVVLHDLNFAMRACQRIILLGDRTIVQDGVPEEVLTETNIHQVYGITVDRKENWILPRL